MSGIVGIHYLDGRPVGDEIDRMVGIMEHRGPDEQAVWTNGPVGLGHCMLHTTPESLHASLPQESAQSGCVITADARIDNREKLIKGLRIHADPDRVIPDTTLILRAYEKWEKDCVDHLLGAFSFAIWDSRRGHFFCAIDHFGVRPFYYHYRQDELFAFASEIKSLLALEGVPEEPNEVRIAGHLTVDVEEDVTRTYFKHIWRLTPAHTLTAQRDSKTEHRYWSLDPEREIHFSSDEEYADRFRFLFREAVRARLRSTGPVGSMLSGGLDSSSIVCQAVQLCGDSKPLHTFSAIFDEDSGSDESPYIGAVLDKYQNLKPHFIKGDAKSPLAEWDELQKHVDGACTAGNAYIFWRSLQQAKKHGVRVVLDGFDGDTTLSHGMGFLQQLRHERRLLSLAWYSWARAKATGESEREVVWAWLKAPILSMPGISQLATLRNTLKSFMKKRDETPSDDTVSPKWQRVLSQEMTRKIEPHLAESTSPPNKDHEYHCWQLERHFMKRIPDLWDQMAGAHSVNFRYPFFDKRLVEFCVALPPRQKLRRGWSRLVLRQAMEGVLPSQVQWRKGKGHLSNALDTCIATYERPLLEKLGTGRIGEINRYVSSDFLKESAPKYLDGRIGSGGGGRGVNDGVTVWRSLSLALWLRHMEKENPRDEYN